MMIKQLRSVIDFLFLQVLVDLKVDFHYHIIIVV